MKNAKLPSGLTYIGEEIRLVMDPETRKPRTKAFSVVMDVNTDRFYLVDKAKGGMYATMFDYKDRKTVLESKY